MPLIQNLILEEIVLKDREYMTNYPKLSEEALYALSILQDSTVTHPVRWRGEGMFYQEVSKADNNESDWEALYLELILEDWNWLDKGLR